MKGVVERLPEAVEGYVRKVVEAFGFSYSVGMQFRAAPGQPDTFFPLEINPRFQGTTVISIGAGVNVPELLLDMALKAFDFDFTPAIRYGLRLERIYYELFSHDNAVFTLEDTK